MGSDYGFTSLSTHAREQDYDKYKAVPVAWSGSEAWQTNDARPPVFAQDYRPGRTVLPGGPSVTKQQKKADKYSTLEKNAAAQFEAAVGSAEAGVTVYGVPDIVTTGGDGVGGAGGSATGTGGYTEDTNWALWGSVAVGSGLILFLLSRYKAG